MGFYEQLLKISPAAYGRYLRNLLVKEDFTFAFYALSTFVQRRLACQDLAASELVVDPAQLPQVELFLKY